MNDPLPAPEFDRSQYERPNQAWVCGRTCEGKPCRLGPSPGGHCRSTAECRPLLEVRPGETKGRWKCTRSREAGGPCATGPGPDGQCGCPIIPCVPQSSLRRLRGRLTLATISFTIGLLVLLCAGPWRWAFISPGPVSQPHGSPGFQHDALTHFGSSGCAGCHEAAEGGLGQWLQTAFRARPGPFDWKQLALAKTDHHSRMDERNCLACHADHDRHQPTVVAAHSCTDCHREHQGRQLAAPRDETCASCHNDGPALRRFTRPSTDDPLDLHPPLVPGLSAFITPRRAGGRTNQFAHYWDGHPDFGLHVAGLKDGNTLKFNHQLHFGTTVRMADAGVDETRGLNCRDCHQPDSTGAYMARIRFDLHCQSCHSLQFDPVNPEMKLPHASPAAVRAGVASLATLQVQYANLARIRGETDRARIDDFARANADRVRRLLGTGEQLLDLILFTGDPRPRMFPEDQGSTGKRAHYAGCAYCHEVTRDAQGQAQVTRPRIPDRWLPGGRFNHAKHPSPRITCLECHGTVLQSTRTSDINLPHQTATMLSAADRNAGLKACIDCHTENGAPANCATCHSYHMLKPL